MKNWSNQPTGSYKKSGAKILLLVVIALYRVYFLVVCLFFRTLALIFKKNWRNKKTNVMPLNTLPAHARQCWPKHLVRDCLCAVLLPTRWLKFLTVTIISFFFLKKGIDNER